MEPNTNQNSWTTPIEPTTNLDDLAQGGISPKANQNRWTTPIEPTTNLDKLSKDSSPLATKLSHQETIPVTDHPVQETVISRLNAIEKVNTVPVTMKLENFSVAEEVKDKPMVVLGESGIHLNMSKRSYVLRYWRIFVISIVITIAAGTTSLVLGLYNRYISLASQPVVSQDNQQYVDNYKKVQKFLKTTLNNSSYQKYAVLWLAWSDAEQNVQTILQTSQLNYLTKKDFLQMALNQFTPIFIANKASLEDLKQEVTKYGFFSEELFELLKDEEYTMSIKDSLLSLEMIKFSSAIKVFSYLDTFVSTVSTMINMSPAMVQTKLSSLTTRGEKDIALYLNNCYLNPYEVDYDCNLVWDFDRYYSIVDKDQSWFDKSFFKKIMSYVDAKLEQSELPSFAITFQRFDPNQKKISFEVDVNTFQQDEVALIKKWIINPHIFVVTNLLNLIKQSLFVISENVDAKQLKIVSKTVKIWSTVFTINSSTMNFILPIQQTTQREITDYTSKDLLNTSP